ncbi:hypothetical protein [Neobacillus sp. Marseille-QA0830]
MNNNQLPIIRKTETKEAGNGYKIVKMNVSDPSENLFAVVTPVKKQ